MGERGLLRSLVNDRALKDHRFQTTIFFFKPHVYSFFHPSSPITINKNTLTKQIYKTLQFDYLVAQIAKSKNDNSKLI